MVGTDKATKKQIRWAVWKHISEDQVGNLCETMEPDMIKGKLREWLLPSPPETIDDDVADVLVDFHFYNYVFTREMRFTSAQASAFLSIMKDRLEEDAAWGERTGAGMNLSFEAFKDELLRHGVERPPWSIGLFDPEAVVAITEFVVENYYRHYNLYKYLLTSMPLMTLTQMGPNEVEEPFSIKPLAAATQGGAAQSPSV
jgi:hypothetical protein